MNFLGGPLDGRTAEDVPSKLYDVASIDDDFVRNHRYHRTDAGWIYDGVTWQEDTALWHLKHLQRDFAYIFRDFQEDA